MGADPLELLDLDDDAGRWRPAFSWPRPLTRLRSVLSHPFRRLVMADPTTPVTLSAEAQALLVKAFSDKENAVAADAAREVADHALTLATQADDVARQSALAAHQTAVDSSHAFIEKAAAELGIPLPSWRILAEGRGGESGGPGALNPGPRSFGA